MGVKWSFTLDVGEIYRGKKDKFLTVVCNLETAEPLWFG